jgi:hypothetical protein
MESGGKSFRMIVTVSGLIGEGKGTVADMLVDKYGFRKDSFAATLKDATAAIFGWERHLLEGDTNESREFRETEDEWWTKNLDMGHSVTPRWVLQNIGTEVFRKNFHSDIWVLSAMRKHLDTNDNIVFPDARFPNEFEWVKEFGGYTIVVERVARPEWWEVAVNANEGSDYAQSLMTQFGIHPSEYEWVGRDFDFVITNKRDLVELEKRVDEVYEKICKKELDKSSR